MSVGVNLLFAVGRRRLTDVEKTKRSQAELKEFNRELREALRSKNKSKEEKLLKRKKQMDGLQAKLMMDNFKVSILFFIPLIGLWWLVSGIVGYDVEVARSPIVIDLLFIRIGPQLNLFWWYMITSFAFSGIITKATGTSLTD